MDKTQANIANEKIVTCDDLPALRRIQEAVGHSGCGPLVQRLIAAAEADRPTLPEGWVVFYDAGQVAVRHLWHSGRGNLYTHDQPMAQFLVGKVGDDDLPRDCLTPLRPTIDAETLEKAARAAAEQSTAIKRDVWSAVPESTQELWRGVARAAFAAAGFEVGSVLPLMIHTHNDNKED